jgi:hypothetical protein
MGMDLAAGPEIAVFHDESGDFGHGDWAFIGLLWMRMEDVDPLAEALRAQRAAHGGEIHFYRFPRNFGGEYGAAARVARSWFELWRGEWARRIWLNVLAVNRRHVRYDSARFANPQVAYVHFAALALKIGLASFFKEHATLRLTLCSDERSGRPEGGTGAAAASASETFARALRMELAQALERDYTGPQVAPAEMPISCLSSQTGGGHFSAEQELLQLTDLLLGAASTAIEPKSVAATKLWFAREMASIIEDVRKPAGAQTLELRGRLLISSFPDPVGRIYHDGALGIREM